MTVKELKGVTMKRKESTKTASDVYDWDKLDMIIRKCESIDKELGFLLDILRWTGLRVSDALDLRYKDVMGEVLRVTEKKTNKSHESKIRHRFKERMNYWLGINEPKDVNELIFKSVSRDGVIQPKNQTSLLKRFQYVSKRHNGGCNKVGFHSVRKSFGYKLYEIGKNNNDVIIQLMRIFNHSRPAITLKYIGVTKEQDEQLLDSLYLDM